MILRINIKNFVSFYEEQEFNLFPNPKRESFPSHIYNTMAVPLLKLSAIYGANGSGKSNFLEAVRFLKRFATEKDFLKTFPIEMNKFRLASEKNTQPIHISIEFSAKKESYIYSFYINDFGVEKEELWISGVGKTENKLIYRREQNRLQLENNNLSGEIEETIQHLFDKNPKASLLALNKEFPIIKSEEVNDATWWLNEQLHILSLRRVNPTLLAMLENDEFYSFASNILKKIGIGFNKMVIEEKELSEILSNEDEESQLIKNEILKNLDKNLFISKINNDKVVFSFEKKDNRRIVKQLLFEQEGIGNYKANIEFEAQSDGTAKVMNLIPALYDIRNNDCAYFIDEIENSIHPALITELIKYVGEMKTKGQLIFSTHETELLNQQEILRPDEIWFTEKHQGCTQLYSLNDFKIHNTINIKNGYLEGRFGAIPFLGTLNDN